MKIKEFMDLGIKLDEGVLITKHLMNIPLANPENASRIKGLFESHNYKMDTIPGAFLKIFTLNEREIADLEKVLNEIDELKMQDLFDKNKKVAYFKRTFLEQLSWCMNNGVPFLNSDNTFASFFDNAELFAEYTASVPKEQVKSTLDPELTIEDKQVYNEIIQKLNYLILANPMDAKLTEVVNNTLKKVVEPITRKEYKFLGIYEMVENVMFDGLDITPEENERITELVSSVLPKEERKLA